MRADSTIHVGRTAISRPRRWWDLVGSSEFVTSGTSRGATVGTRYGWSRIAGLHIHDMSATFEGATRGLYNPAYGVKIHWGGHNEGYKRFSSGYHHEPDRTQSGSTSKRSRYSCLDLVPYTTHAQNPTHEERNVYGTNKNQNTPVHWNDHQRTDPRTSSRKRERITR